MGPGKPGRFVFRGRTDRNVRQQTATTTTTTATATATATAATGCAADFAWESSGNQGRTDLQSAAPAPQATKEVASRPTRGFLTRVEKG